MNLCQRAQAQAHVTQTALRFCGLAAGCQPKVQLAALGIAEMIVRPASLPGLVAETSPSIARDGAHHCRSHTMAWARLVRSPRHRVFSCIDCDAGQNTHPRPVWRELMEIIRDQLGPVRLLNVSHRCSCRRFPTRLLGRMSEDSGERGEEQIVEFLVVLRRQLSGQHAPSARHGACDCLNVKCSGPSTRPAAGLLGDRPENRQGFL